MQKTPKTAGKSSAQSASLSQELHPVRLVWCPQRVVLAVVVKQMQLPPPHVGVGESMQMSAPIWQVPGPVTHCPWGWRQISPSSQSASVQHRASGMHVPWQSNSPLGQAQAPSWQVRPAGQPPQQSLDGMHVPWQLLNPLRQAQNSPTQAPPLPQSLLAQHLSWEMHVAPHGFVPEPHCVVGFAGLLFFLFFFLRFFLASTSPELSREFHAPVMASPARSRAMTRREPTAAACRAKASKECSLIIFFRWLSRVPRRTGSRWTGSQLVADRSLST
jgi:hypothetical protein